ncbi:hypothetical protein Tco_0018236 [Tanacetum coccineum]
MNVGNEEPPTWKHIKKRSSDVVNSRGGKQPGEYMCGWWSGLDLGGMDQEYIPEVDGCWAGRISSSDLALVLVLLRRPRSVWRDLFAVADLGPVVVVAAELSFFAGCVSDIWRGIVETIVFAMSSMMSCVGCKKYVLELAKLIKDNIFFLVMTSLVKCTALQERVGGWEWADMKALYCKNPVEEDSEFARRMGVLLQEMVVAYDDRVDFIRELEVVPGIAASVKTDEFLNDAL